MAYWKEVLTHFTTDAEGRMAELRGRLDAQLGGPGPLKIVAFRGYGSPERLSLRGRVIEEIIPLAGVKDDRVWANLVRIYTREQAEPVPHAILTARFQDTEQILTADDEGYFQVRFHPTRPLAEQRTWHPIELNLVSPIPDIQSRYPIKATGQVLVPPAGARYGLISTVDSTLQTSNLTYIARSAFLRSPRARLPFPGEAALYQAFYGGMTGAEMNPIIYISANSSNHYDLLVQHLNLQSMPNGPLLFSRGDPAGHVRRILEFYPHLPFLLIGDANGKDAGIFARLACEFPGRIQAIYLRGAAGSQSCIEIERARQAGCRIALAENALELASQAVKHGFLSLNALPGITKHVQKDQCPLSPLEELIAGAGEKGDQSAKISHQVVTKNQAGPGPSVVPTWPRLFLPEQKLPPRHTNKKNK